jgi:hypothetical protein
MIIFKFTKDGQFRDCVTIRFSRTLHHGVSISYAFGLVFTEIIYTNAKGHLKAVVAGVHKRQLAAN